MKEIPITRSLVTVVDDDVYEWASQFRWYAEAGANTHYAVRSGKRQLGQPRERFALHRLILGLPPWQPGGDEVDHIDRNGLNNQRANLRVVDHAGNAVNRDNRRRPDRLCETCGTPFHPHGERARFCSLRCFGRRPDNPLINRCAAKLGFEWE